MFDRLFTATAPLALPATRTKSRIKSQGMTWIAARGCRVATCVVALGCGCLASVAQGQNQAAGNGDKAEHPNVVLINLDDMGVGDFSVYGSPYSITPNIDRLASQGIRFTRFYASAPICSPSRVGLFTGQFPARHRINSFLDDVRSNDARDNVNSLSLDAPNMARLFKTAGYATGHFGKWHMGGGRDVGYIEHPSDHTKVQVPRVAEYGYDAVWTQMEGLGNRIVNVQDHGGDQRGTTERQAPYMNGLNRLTDELGTNGGQDQLVYLEREHNAAFMVDHAMAFLDRVHANDPAQPFFINVWFDEVHTPHDPPAALIDAFNKRHPELPRESLDYLAVLQQADSDVGRLMAHLEQLGVADNTIVLVMSDNGPVKVNAERIGSAWDLRGTKGDLHEGGFRQPLIVRWPNRIDADQTNEQTVVAMMDLLPSLATMCQVDVQGAWIDRAADGKPSGELDGQDMAQALLGDATMARSKDIFWNTNRGTENRHRNGGAEAMALRRGDWKLIVNADGQAPELYNIAQDPQEAHNRADSEPARLGELMAAASSFRYQMPAMALPDTSNALAHFRASDLQLADGASVMAWPDSATADAVNATPVQGPRPDARPTHRANAINGQAAVAFDGNDWLKAMQPFALPDPNAGLTVVAVVTLDESDDPAKRLFQIGPANGQAGQTVAMDVSSSQAGMGFRFNNGAALADSPKDKKQAGRFHLVIWQIEQNATHAQAKLCIDGVAQNQWVKLAANNPSNALDLASPEMTWSIGGGTSRGSLLTADQFKGQLAELIVYNDVLSIPQLNLVANAMATRYGLDVTYDTTFAPRALRTLTQVAH